MSGLLIVQPEDLQRLTPEMAVEFFRRFLWAEASSLGIAANLINVPSAITVGDGGVDAEVRNAPGSGGEGVIKQGVTRYQIKAGQFSLQPSDLRTLLFRGKPNAHLLLPRVKSCFDSGGTFIAVLFGCDIPDRTDDEAVNKIRDILREQHPQYADARIEVWRQNQLCGFFSKHQPLAAELTGRANWRFRTHGSWASEFEMRRPLKLGVDQEKLIDRLRNELRKHDDAVHVRVCGQAGIGKTRIVLEATRAADLAPLVAYYGTATELRDDGLRSTLQREGSDLSILIVVDDCDPEYAVEFWNDFRHCGPRVKLISLYQDREQSSGTTIPIEAEALAEPQVSSILQEYGIEKPDADRWARECDGSPRVAHIFGQNLKEDPDADVLRDVDTVRVWDRFIAGHDPVKSDRAERSQRVLNYLALFKRVGFGPYLGAEARSVHRLIEQDDSKITWATFQEVIAELRQRKILQGETTLYITPAALQMKLLADFWNLYGSWFRADEFIEGLDGRLLEWFYEMFEYASISPVAKKIVRTLLGPGGPFADSDYLKTRLGSSFFLALTKADPEASLRCLQRTVETWDLDTRLSFTEGRRDVIYALQCIAIWRDLFCDAARLLLALAEAENESWSNNASGVFADLFSPGLGNVAPTEAPPETRFPVLTEALLSASPQRRALGLRACDRALEAGQFIRTSGPEHQGYRNAPKLWRPATYGEWFDAYRRVWQFLHDQIPPLSTDERGRAVQILVSHSYALSMVDTLKEMVFGTLRDLATRPETDKKQILRIALDNLSVRRSSLSDEAVAVWQDIERNLTGNDFHARLRRFVGLQTWHEKLGDPNSETRKALTALAEEAVRVPSALIVELGWLVTSAAENGYAFGYQLGVHDISWTFKSPLLDALRNAGSDGAAHTVGGYLWAMLERDRNLWALEMDCLAQDETLPIWLPEISRRTELNDHLAELILALAKEGRIAPDRLGLFAFGGTIRVVTPADGGLVDMRFFSHATS